MKKTTLVIRKILALCLAVLTAFSVLGMAASAEDGEAFRLLFDFQDEGPWHDTCTVVGYEGTVPEHLVIPESENGYWVCAIGDRAFAGCDTLKSVSGDTLASIGTAAFADCDNLETVSFGGGDFFDGFTISAYAFHNCKKLKTFSMPLETRYNWVDSGAFMGCSALEEITWQCPNVRENAFLGCYSLKTVHMVGYKPDFDYEYPEGVVQETGNSTYIYADWDWMRYPQDDELFATRQSVEIYAGETSDYTLETPVGAEESLYCCYVYSDGTSVWADTNTDAPGTVQLTAAPNEEGFVQFVFLVLDKDGNVAHEEYVDVHVSFSPRQEPQNEWETLKTMIRELFHRTLFYRVLHALFPQWI